MWCAGNIAATGAKKASSRIRWLKPTSPRGWQSRARGDRTLFGSEAGVEAAWRVVNAVLNCDEPQHEYDSGSWGPAAAEQIAAHIGGWIEPSRTGYRSTLGPEGGRDERGPSQ